MTRTALISSSDELRERLRPLTGGTAFNPHLPVDPPDVLIVDCRPDADEKLALAATLAETCPTTGILLVSDDPAALALPALRIGVQDILAPESALETFGGAVESIVRARPVSEAPRETAPANDAPHGRIISVMSPKGGVGKTTVSTNIAVGLAQREPGSTVIVDLDVQFGDVASSLDLEPTHFLGDVLSGAARYDAVVLKTFLTQHKTGLYAICAPNMPAEADKISSDDITHLLQVLSQEFRYVVLDTAPGMTDTTLAALDQTTDLVLLTSMDVPGVRGLRKELETLATLGVSPATRQVVLNFADPKGLLSQADVEATLKTKVDLTLPRTRATVNSINQGVPLLESGLRDPVTKQLTTLVDRLVTRQPAAANNAAVQTQPRRQSWWRRNKQVAAA